MPNRSELVPVQIVSHDPFTRGLFMPYNVIRYKEIMSVLHHESILETLFEECLEGIAKAGLDATSDAAHAVAAIRAEQMFEEMCQ